MRNDATYFKNFKFRKFRNIGNFEIDCLKSDGSIQSWTLLLGNNNVGKTGILKAIADLRVKKIDISDSESPYETEYRPVGVFAPYYLTSSLHSDSDFLNDKNWGYGGKGYGLANCCSFFDKDPSIDLYAYGVSRYPAFINLTESVGDSCASLLDTEGRLVNVQEWLMQMHFSILNGDEEVKKLFSLFKSLICDGMLFPEIHDIKFSRNEKLENFVLFETEDGAYKFKELGFGYQSMLSWVSDFCYRMLVKHPKSENPFAEPAIVLLDEIDLNLHPQWQRDVIKILSDKFPNTQFIATTHSPFVVQSMESVNLYVLNREGKDVTISRVPGHDFRGWSVEDILANIMELHENVNSDEYNRLFKMFDNGLDTDNYAAAKEAYGKLCELLPENSNARRILDIQFLQIVPND